MPPTLLPRPPEPPASTRVFRALRWPASKIPLRGYPSNGTAPIHFITGSFGYAVPVILCISRASTRTGKALLGGKRILHVLQNIPRGATLKRRHRCLRSKPRSKIKPKERCFCPVFHYLLLKSTDQSLFLSAPSGHCSPEVSWCPRRPSRANPHVTVSGYRWEEAWATGVRQGLRVNSIGRNKGSPPRTR